jgi:hypothetical protein
MRSSIHTKPDTGIEVAAQNHAAAQYRLSTFVVPCQSRKITGAPGMAFE